ncbi:MAG: ABC transporter permease [Gemmatimonadales bacterium]
MAHSIRGFESAELAATLPSPGLTALAPRRGLRRPAGIVGLSLVCIILAIAVFAPWLTAFDPFLITGPSLAAPSLAHLMGTDAIGRDLFSGILFGSRASLLIAVAVGLLAMICGVAIGSIAGFRGGVVDDLLMRITEAFQVLPRFFLVVVVIAVFGPGTLRLVLILGLTSWPTLARVVRGEVIAVRQLDFVLASEALGASQLHLIRHVLLPHVLPAVFVLMGLMMGQVLLIEASLGFLGLGDPTVITWGTLAGQADGFLRTGWWLALFPGLAITMAVLGLNLTGDALSSSLQGR